MQSFDRGPGGGVAKESQPASATQDKGQILRLRNVITMMSTTLAGGGLSLLLTLIVARLLSPVRNGYYAQFSLVLNLYYIVANFGLGPASTYLISSGQVDERRVTTWNVRALGVIGVLSLLAVIGFGMSGSSRWIEAQFNIPQQMFSLGLTAGFGLLVFNQGIAILLGKKLFDTVNGLNLLKAALPLLGLGLTVLVFIDETGFAFATMLALAATSIVSTWFVFRSIAGSSRLHQKHSVALTRSIFRYGGIVYASNVLHYLAMRGLLIILSYYYASEAVGFFSIALVLLETVLVIPGVVGQLLFPQSSSPQFNYGLTDTIMRFNVYVGVLAIIGVLLFATPLLTLILGAKYQPVAVAYLHLTPSILLLAVPRILSQVLSGRGHPEYPLYAAVISFFVGGVVALWSIPAFGVAGAAWVTNLVSAVTAAITVYGYTKLRGVKVSEVFKPRHSDFDLVVSAAGRMVRGGATR